MKNSIQKPSLEEWRELYQVALAFKQIEPWNWMTDSDVFGVKNPETGEIGYCSVFGCLGELFALNVYLGTDGLEGYNKVARGQIKDDKLIFTQRTLMASFEDSKYAQKEDKEIINQLKFNFRGRNSYPLFRSYRPGFFPWFLTADEARFLTLALKQANELVLRFRDDRDLLISPPREYYLVRVYDSKGGKGSWRDEWLKPEPIIQEEIIIPKIDFGRIAIIRDDINKNEIKPAGVWEIDYFFTTSAVKVKNNPRPFYPKSIMFAHHDSYLILHYQMFDNPAASLEEFADEFLGFLKKNKIYPQTVLVKKKDLYGGLKDICSVLNIKLEQAGRLKSIISASNSMKNFLNGHF